MNEAQRRGRPSGYGPEMAEQILTALMEGESLAVLCQRPDMPSQRTVHRWLVKHPEFRSDYVMARAIQADRLAEEILEIADGTDKPHGKVRNSIQRARLRIQARKWYLGRLQPHTHGPAVAASAVPAAAPQVPSLNATERVQRLLALVKDARGGAPIEQTATGEPTASGDVTNDDQDGAAE